MFVLIAALALGTGAAFAQAVITFEKSSYSFGKFNENDPQTMEFVFTNTGDKPLVIQQAMASCGCTVPSYSLEPIAPGKKGKLKVVYSGKGKLPGPFKKTVSVRSNATNSLVRVYIEGDMIAAPKDEGKK